MPHKKNFSGSERGIPTITDITELMGEDRSFQKLSHLTGTNVFARKRE